MQCPQALKIAGLVRGLLSRIHPLRGVRCDPYFFVSMIRMRVILGKDGVPWTMTVLIGRPARLGISVEGSKRKKLRTKGIRTLPRF
jgi:hypothetical protein